MEVTETIFQIEGEPVKFAPDLDNKLNAFQKKPRKEFVGEGRVVISLDDALQASRLSQLFHECYLSATYEDRIRILHTSIVHQAEEELTKLMEVTPELNNVDLTNDPGRHLLMQRARQSKEAFEPHAKVLVANSIEDLYELFTTCIEYAFFKRRKQKLNAEFEVAADKMDEIKNRYHLSGRYKRNARVAKGSKPKRQKPNTDYLQKYKRIDKQTNAGLDEIA